MKKVLIKTLLKTILKKIFERINIQYNCQTTILDLDYLKTRLLKTICRSFGVELVEKTLSNKRKNQNKTINV